MRNGQTSCSVDDQQWLCEQVTCKHRQEREAELGSKLGDKQFPRN
jgi:hypothetical protein